MSILSTLTISIARHYFTSCLFSTIHIKYIPLYLGLSALIVSIKLQDYHSHIIILCLIRVCLQGRQTLILSFDIV